MKSLFLATVVAVAVVGPIAMIAPAYASTLPTEVAASTAEDPWVTNVSRTDSTFYPRVVDDYKDYTKVTWDTADTNFSECWASVSDADGRVLLDENSRVNWQTDFDYDCAEGSGDKLWWNGLNKDGKPVPVGTYKITVRYLDEDEQVIHQFSRPVTVATGAKWFRESFSDRGASFDRKSASGNCQVNRLQGDAELDCWGGRYAKVNYSRYVQYDLAIKDFKWQASGTPGCCARGTISKTATRHGHDVHIYVKVTKWRSYEVDRVAVSWMAKNRI